jgi:hypothetical protein
MSLARRPQPRLDQGEKSGDASSARRDMVRISWTRALVDGHPRSLGARRVVASTKTSVRGVVYPCTISGVAED